MDKNLNNKLNITKIISEIKRVKQLINKPSTISDFTMARTYSRIKSDESKENRIEIFERVTRGITHIFKEELYKINKYGENKPLLGKFQENLFKFMFLQYGTPPGRGLWAQGTPLIIQDRKALALVNCTAITSRNLNVVKQEYFRYIMDTLMLGVGVGFDVFGADMVHVYQPIRANFGINNSYHDLPILLNKYNDNGFYAADGESYVTKEIKYVNNLMILHKNYVKIHVVEDSREGWTDAIAELIKTYLNRDQYFILFDYSKVRVEGIPLKKFGGVSSGPKPLIEAIASIRYILENAIGRTLNEVELIDIPNIIARTVIAGNVRRSSQLCLSESEKILECKNYYDKVTDENGKVSFVPTKYAYRALFGWGSNNSIRITNRIEQDHLNKIIDNCANNGEPGLYFMGNAQNNSRMVDTRLDGVFNPVIGRSIYTKDNGNATNPCGEINLETTTKEANDTPYSAGGETCNLFETFPSKLFIDFINSGINWELLYEAIHDTNLEYPEEKAKLDALLADYYDVLEVAQIYCKLVTMIPVHWKATDDIQNRNRRTGVSISGVSILLTQMGLLECEHINDIPDHWQDEKSLVFKRFAVFLDAAYKKVRDVDVMISNILNIPESIRVTTIKPSGTVSLVNDIPSGMHFPISKHYIRRVRINKSFDKLISSTIKHGFIVEDVENNPNTVAINFPIYNGETFTRDEITVDLQMKILIYLQRYWADNQVSNTVTFKKEEIPRLKELVFEHQDKIKGFTCMPHFDYKNCTYKQLPNEPITKDEYDALMGVINNKFDFYNCVPIEDDEQDTYCDGDKCVKL